MILKACKGYELEKALPNTSEDFFNRSEVTFTEGGSEKTLHVLYVRYFEQLKGNFSPFHEDPVFQFGSKEVFFRDIVALAALVKNPELRNRKRIYVSTEKEFASIFQDLDYEKLKSIAESLENNKGYEL
ncbi:hypothetical protein [Robertmurraya andreesenii]|uniref:Uncharacterized protein n=1 Tax=Anoxybacillus andreesenii TaxID=1325932 RepID=A0ABT9V8F7_9BACL|nr:hypothetical protein [Robertmurraya andreesenii]MDQ0157219.1 hypothetical protein [Robertmurraya andreesenii]